MLEMNITIKVPDLASAINRLATAIGGRKIENQSETVALNPVPTKTPEAPISLPVQTTPAPAVSTPTPAPIPPIPTAAPTYKLEDLQQAMAPLFDAGKQKAVQDAVTGMGYTSLFDMPTERYGELATILRGLGAQI